MLIHFVVVCLMQVVPSHPQGQGRTTIPSDVLRDLRAQRAIAKTLEVAYSYRRVGAADSGNVIWRRLAFAGPDTLLMETSHGTTRHRWQDFKKRVCHYVSGDTMLTHWPNELCIARTPVHGDSLPADLLDDPFLRASGWWPRPTRFRAGSLAGASYDLLDALEGQAYVLESATTGPAILRLTGPRDTIELDATRGHALVAREWRADDGRILMRVRCSEHCRLADGFWVPERIETELFADPANPSIHMIGRLETARLQEIEFDYGFLREPGLAELDIESGTVTQVNPGGQWFLESQAQEAARFASAPPARQNLILWLSGTLAWAGALLLLRRRSGASAAPGSTS